VTRRGGWPPPEVVAAFRTDAPTYFALHSHREGDCLIWDGSLTTTGYGHMGLGGYDVRVPRLVLELATAARPSQDYALHTCDNRRCIERAHLYWGDFAKNMADMAARGRVAHGERHGWARLTEEDVRAIRRKSGARQLDLARLYGVSRSTVSSVLRGETWRHVEGGAA
jgi:hypothetical protein